MPDRTHSYLILIFSRQEKIAIFPPNQVNKSLQRVGKQKLCTAPCSSFKPPGGNSDAFMEAPACVEATKIDLFGCLIQSQNVPNVWEQIARVLQSYLVFEVANHPLNCRGIFLLVYSSRAKKRCNCYLVSGLTHIFHLPSILGMVSSIVQHALGCDCPCWPKPGWCSGRRRQHELLTTNWKT